MVLGWSIEPANRLDVHAMKRTWVTTNTRYMERYMMLCNVLYCYTMLQNVA
jgi:hypothetical protein